VTSPVIELHSLFASFHQLGEIGLFGHNSPALKLELIEISFHDVVANLFRSIVILFLPSRVIL
jgi:hypothetical protein